MNHTPRTILRFGNALNFNITFSGNRLMDDLHGSICVAELGF